MPPLPRRAGVEVPLLGADDVVAGAARLRAVSVSALDIDAASS